MQTNQNNEVRGIARRGRNIMDGSDVDKQYTGKRRVSRSRASALSANSITPAWQRQKESTTAVPARGNGCQRFTEPAGPKRGQLTVRNFEWTGRQQR